MPFLSVAWLQGTWLAAEFWLGFSPSVSLHPDLSLYHSSLSLSYNAARNNLKILQRWVKEGIQDSRRFSTNHYLGLLFKGLQGSSVVHKRRKESRAGVTQKIHTHLKGDSSSSVPADYGPVELMPPFSERQKIEIFMWHPRIIIFLNTGKHNGKSTNNVS